MEGEIGALQVEKQVRNEVKRQMEKTQREYYLNEQMKAIQKELGDSEDGISELDEIEAQLKALKLPKTVLEKAFAELKKLRNMGPMSAEATVVRNYLDWIIALPWKKASRLKRILLQRVQCLMLIIMALKRLKIASSILLFNSGPKVCEDQYFALLGHLKMVNVLEINCEGNWAAICANGPWWCS